MEQVSWFDAIEYCNQRSQREGLSLAYTINGLGDNRTVIWNHSANGYRLPTEAEWEYACRAGTITRYNIGDYITGNLANYNGRHLVTTFVGSFIPNLWGLYDMHGNVAEWCWDWSDSYSGKAETDPVGASSGSYRVLRGADWLHPAQFVRSAYRPYGKPSRRSAEFGFRLVRSYFDRYM